MNLSAAGHILKEYHKQYNMRLVPIKIDSIRNIIVSMGYIGALDVFEVDYEQKNILGEIKFFARPYGNLGDYATIYVNSRIEYEWKRFVIAKEMCHVVLDEEGDRVGTEAEFRTLIELLSAGNPANNSAAMSETIAVALALELLFPLEHRNYWQSDVQSGKVTIGELALRFQIPEIYIEVAMYEKFLEASRKMRDGNLIDLK
ncbi:MAG: ImmA/IrrE family metallo-endopeptidase [Zavarzinia sp.]|nr:ImmA/IrrE family metallo-endopeptidase [Zavarzinia sp.]